MTQALTSLATAFRAGAPVGITSVCSAHPIVIEATLRFARDTGGTALIEATCNQVNQDGGHVGMTPAAFRDFVLSIADRVGAPADRVILGGDHLGPSPWRRLPAAEAMDKAEAMIAAYASAGFAKLHLDASMGCAGEPVGLPDAVAAERAARLARAAEANAAGTPPVYVIGAEVPTPGGAVEALHDLDVTKAEAAAATHAAHRAAFAAAGIETAFERVIALVVQPGVEFGHADVAPFDLERARALTAALEGLSGVVFEAHSTDYRTEAALSALVRGGFAILKVGPWLTFALREALYGLDAVADVLDGHPPRGMLMARMDEIMRAAPDHWRSHYSGDAQTLWMLRHFSYSDRIRYYWPDAGAGAAVRALTDRLAGREIPETVLGQFLPRIGPGAGRAEDVLIEAVTQVLRLYDRACRTA
ncbi:MAG: class II D-tagatose-bisphosphate aldolase non-catalytic subunit [Rubrimonas sp.]